MADTEKNDLTADEPQPDEQDLTPPHGDELRSEETFGRTDRYSNVDDADAERLISDVPSSPDVKAEAAERHKRFDEIDEREADEARMDVRRREPRTDAD